MNYLEQINVQIKQCKLKDSVLKEQEDKIRKIGDLYNKFTEFKLKNEKVDQELKEIQMLIQKLIDHYQSRGYRWFLDSEKSRLQNAIPYKIGLLLMNLQTKEKQLDTLTTSDLMSQNIIQAGSIQIEADLILTHQSFKKLEARMYLEFQEEQDEQQIFSLYLKRKTLFSKLLAKIEATDDQMWTHYFESKLQNKDLLFFYIIRDRKKKVNQFFSPIKPFIIKNFYQIYLCTGMKIVYGEAKELIVEACSAPQNGKVHDQFSSNCIQSTCERGSIKMIGYNYIKFRYTILDKSYEFYLKNKQNIDLEEYLPGIKAKLYNDERGFYIACKDEKNEDIKLHTYQELTTISSNLPFCIQLSRECTLELRFNKDHSKIVELS